MFKFKSLMGLAGLMAMAGHGFAAVNSVASLANPMENVGVGARALSMGSAFVGVADDSSALFWNPAGLGGMRDLELALHHNSWLAGIIQETAIAALPLGFLGGFGASLNYVNYGTFNGYDVNGDQIDSYSANRYGFGLGWGKELMAGLSAGAALRGGMRTINDSNYTDIAMDFGALWAPVPVKNLRLGLAYSNLGTAIASYGQAAALRLGGSYGMELSRTNQLLLAASGSFEPQGVNRLQCGVEDTIHSFLALRLGYQANLADTQIQGLTGLTAGFGVLYEGFCLDYAYLPFGDLGAAQRISLGYKFGRTQKPS